MASVIHVEALEDPRLLPYRALKERHLAEAMGLFIAEGEHLTRRLLTAAPRFEAVSILVSDHRVDSILPAVPEHVAVYVLPEPRISEVIGYPFHLGMLACGRRPELGRIETLFHARTLVVCPHLQNLENLGLIIRTAAALGVDGLLVGEKGSDPFFRRCVRVSMGSVFTLPIVRSGDVGRDLRQLRDERGFELVATVLAPDAVPLTSYQRGERVAVMLGNEPDGLEAGYLRLATHKVIIPMHNDVDSLNVAVAAGIVLHHVTAG